MELRDIEYFAVVAEHGHLGRAAEALGLSQSAVSKSVRRLEQILEARLVRRTPVGVSLTAEGTALLARVQVLRLSLRDISSEIRELSRGQVGSLRIGVGPGLDEQVLTTACAALVNDAPKVALQLVSGDNDILIPALRNGELDMVVNFLPPAPYEGLAQEAVHEVVNVVCARASHPLASLPRLTLADLAGARWVVTVFVPTMGSRNWLAQKLLDGGVGAPMVALESRAIRPRLQMLAATDLLGFLPRHIVREAASSYALTELPVEELVLRRQAGVITRSQAYLSPVARRLMELLASAARERPPEV